MESNLIYVPNYNNECVEIINSNTIRVYGDNNEYIEYFPNSHYLWKKGSYETQPIVCVDHNYITSVPMYRNDFAEILFIGLAFIFVGWFFIGKLIRTIFLGWRWA